MNRIAVIASHPDDEILGCGGAMALHARNGAEVNVLLVAEGVTSRDRTRNREERGSQLSALGAAAHAANDVLGASSLTLHDFPDNRMDSVDRLDVIKVVEGFLELHRPDTVYTHHWSDLNIDHRRVHEAVVTACRPVPGQAVSTLLFFEVPSSTDWQAPGAAAGFAPNWFVDIDDTLELKLQALRAYESEMRPWPHARSLDAVAHLARWRGSSIGVAAAEAFVLGRRILSGSTQT